LSLQKIKTAIKNLHQNTPEPIKRLYAPLFKWRYSKQYINRFHTYLPLTLFHGPAKEDGTELTFAYVGQDQEMAAHWVNKIFSQHSIETLGRHWVWTVPELLSKHPSAPSLCLIERTFLTELFPSLNPGINIPYWVQSTIDISTPFEEIPKRKKRGFNDILRRIRKFNLSYYVTKDPKDIEVFYHSMHVPFINNRYDEEAVFLGKKKLRKIFNQSDLIFIKKDDEVIGGDVLQFTRRGAVLRLIGVKDGNPEYLRYGVMGALYYFAILEAQKKGDKTVNVGGTSPFLSDGLTRFKSYLNAKIIPHTYLPKKTVRVMFLKDCDIIKNFLVQNPLVYYPKRFRPHRAQFVTDEHIAEPKKFEQALSSNTIGGISSNDVFIFSKDKDVCKKARWPGLAIGSVRAIADYLPHENRKTFINANARND